MNVADEMGLAKTFFDYCIVKLEDKAHDYAPDGDALKNFHKHGVKGICVRLDDKTTRLETLTDRGRTPKNEPLFDTPMDIANYAFLAFAKMYEDGMVTPPWETAAPKVFKPEKRV